MSGIYRNRRCSTQERRADVDGWGRRRRNLLRMISIDLDRSDWRDRSWKRYRRAQYKPVVARHPLP